MARRSSACVSSRRPISAYARTPCGSTGNRRRVSVSPVGSKPAALHQLPANVREHYGERFVLGANHLLKGTFASLSVADNMSKEKLKPSVSLDCPVCSCDADDGKRADCLIDRFHRAFDSIDSDYIAEMPAATRSTQSFRANSTPLLAARRRSRHGRAEHRNIRARPHPDSAARVPRMVNHLPPSAIRI